MKAPSKSVLVLVDVQKGTSDPTWGRRGNPRAEEVMASVLKNFRANELPVIHVRQEDSLDPDSLFRKGKPSFEFKEEVMPEEGEIIITKNTSNAFIGTNLKELLRKLGEPFVFYAGIATDQCVNTTVRMSGDLGFKSYVIGDACATYDLKDASGNATPAETVHMVHLAAINGAFAETVSSADLEF